MSKDARDHAGHASDRPVRGIRPLRQNKQHPLEEQDARHPLSRPHGDTCLSQSRHGGRFASGRPFCYRLVDIDFSVAGDQVEGGARRLDEASSYVVRDVLCLAVDHLHRADFLRCVDGVEQDPVACDLLGLLSGGGRQGRSVLKVWCGGPAEVRLLARGGGRSGAQEGACPQQGRGSASCQKQSHRSELVEVASEIFGILRQETTASAPEERDRIPNDLTLLSESVVAVQDACSSPQQPANHNKTYRRTSPHPPNVFLSAPATNAEGHPGPNRTSLCAVAGDLQMQPV
jgi:hypothetical protein